MLRSSLRTRQREMLRTKQAIAIGRRGGNARARNLSPELRSELASWAELIRAQRRRGEITNAELRRRLLHKVRASRPDLGALLQFLARLPLRLAYHIYEGLPAQDHEFVEGAIGEVLYG